MIFEIPNVPYGPELAHFSIQVPDAVLLQAPWDKPNAPGCTMRSVLLTSTHFVRKHQWGLTMCMSYGVSSGDVLPGFALAALPMTSETHACLLVRGTKPSWSVLAAELAGRPQSFYVVISPISWRDGVPDDVHCLILLPDQPDKLVISTNKFDLNKGEGVESSASSEHAKGSTSNAESSTQSQAKVVQLFRKTQDSSNVDASTFFADLSQLSEMRRVTDALVFYEFLDEEGRLQYAYTFNQVRHPIDMIKALEIWKHKLLSSATKDT